MARSRIQRANVHIVDDEDAIRRARLAHCHDLRILNCIRINGRMVNSQSTFGGQIRNSRDAGSFAGVQNEPQQQQIRSSQGKVPSYVWSAGSDLQGSTAMSSQSRTDVNISRLQSQEQLQSASSATVGGALSSSPECKGIWCFLRDVSLFYAVAGVTCLLLRFCLFATDSSTGEAYDNIP